MLNVKLTIRFYIFENNLSFSMVKNKINHTFTMDEASFLQLKKQADNRNIRVDAILVHENLKHISASGIFIYLMQKESHLPGIWAESGSPCKRHFFPVWYSHWVHSPPFLWPQR